MTKRGPDANDGKPWSKMDIADLQNHVRQGFTLSETAAFLCRAGTMDEVARKASELGLTFQRPRDRIRIFGPKDDGSYWLELRQADGDSLVVSVPASETHVLKYFQQRIPYGLALPDEPK